MKEDEIYYDVLQMFTKFLSEHQLRKTRERFAILEHIHANNGFFDAETLYDEMKDEFRVSLATVYNTLDLLTSCNLVSRNQFGGSKLIFQKTFGTTAHHHLICSICGRVKEFSDRRFQDYINSKQFASFSISYYTLKLHGVCKKCNAINNKKTKKI